MTKEDFILREKYLWVRYNQLKKETEETWLARKALQESYAEEVLKESAYFVGQEIVDSRGQKWFVSGAFTMDGDVYLNFNFPKKDGTMSKVSGMGRGMPHVVIK